MKKKDPLRLPSVLQHELGMAGNGGTSSGKKQQKKKASLSRKELRKQERQEKKQRKVTPVASGKRGRPDESSQRAGNAGTKRSRSSTSGGLASSSIAGISVPVRKSLGLVERARRGKASTNTNSSRNSTGGSSSKTKKTNEAATDAALASVRKDPFIMAEEEEIRYLERKLGLAGKDGKKKEDKLLRDLMKYEGFDDSIGDLLQATNRISELVGGRKSVGGNSCSSSIAKDKATKKKVGGSRLEALLLAQHGEGGLMPDEDKGKEEEEGEARAWDYEADLGSEEEEEEDEDEEDDDESDDEYLSETKMGRGEGGVPDFLSSDEEGEVEEEDDEYVGEPMEVDMREDDHDDDDNDEEEQNDAEESEDSDAGSSPFSSSSSSSHRLKESREIRANSYHPVKGEDIYGRSTDPSLSANSPAAKYVPPHVRRAATAEATATAAATMTEVDDTGSPEYILLKKVMNGLANRLSETNLEASIRELCSLYTSHPRSRVNKMLTDTLLALCVSKTQVMKAIVPVYAALVAGSHFGGGGSGGGMGAYVLERVCREYDATRKKLEELGGREEEEEEGEEERLARELDNLVLILGYLYAFDLVACGLIYELIRELVAKLGERDVELLLLLLRTAGHQLRGDDPAALKDIVLAVQERASEVIEGGREGEGMNARVRHMLETINDLKNNKKRQAQLQELEKTQRLKKVVQRARNSSSSSSSSSRKGGGDTLHLTWADIRASDERGRWWRVGASWTGTQSPNQGEEEEEERKGKSKSSGGRKSSSSSATDKTLQAKITKLAAKQRMNTDVRRAIFASVMTASDYQDAFERLMRLNLTDQQEREVVRVLVDCAGQEKGYNPFYAYLAGRLCEYHDKYKFTLQLTYWDIFKLLDEEGAGFASPAVPKKGGAGAAGRGAVSPQHHRAVNLAKTLCHLIAKGWLSLSVLKVVDVAGLGEGGGVFFRAFFAEFLDEESCPDKEVLGAVQRVGLSKNHLTLTETLTAFLHRYALSEEEKGRGEEGKKRKKRARSVVKLLDKLSVSQFMGEGGEEGGRRGRRGGGNDDGWDGR